MLRAEFESDVVVCYLLVGSLLLGYNLNAERSLLLYYNLGSTPDSGRDLIYREATERICSVSDCYVFVG